ncbi:FBXO15 isoform 2, partial [Pongo abelii]
MATGRGRILQQHWLGLQTLRGPSRGGGAVRGRARAFGFRMPSEILLKIFSYLDAVSLLCTGCVSRRFYHLANDNFIWIGIYSTAFSPTRSNWKVNSVEKIAMSMSFLSVQDKEAGYWKKEYITKQIASVKAALADIL